MVVWVSAVNSSLDSVEEQAEKLSKEHDCALKVWMCELFVMTIFILANDDLILHFHDDCVKSTKCKHKTHDGVE